MWRIVTLLFILSVSSAFSAIEFESVELGFDKVYKRERLGTATGRCHKPQ